MKHKKLARRQDQRRQVLYSVQHDLVERSTPSETQVEELFSALDRNDLARLGIVKLSGLELDHLYPRSRHRGRGGAPLLTTLLAYAAALQGRDSAVFALLRSGADSTTRATSSGPQSSWTSAVRAYLNRIPSCFAVYVVKKVVEMRQAASEREDGSQFQCLLCDRAGEDVLQWEPCQHCVCEDCFWSSLSLSSDDDDFECFTCRAALGKAGTNSTPLPTKEESLARYLRLPCAGDGKSSASSKPKFRARTLRELAGLYTGVTREQRSSEVFKAAAAGKRMRLEALLYQGADIETRNEYGLTPLFAAVLEGQTETCRILLSAGADPQVLDNSGATLATAACAAPEYNVTLIELLRNAGVNFETQGTVGISARKYLALHASEEERKEEDGLCYGLSTLSLDGAYFNAEDAVVTELIPSDSSHPGAGSVIIDNGFTESFMEQLEALFRRLPVAPAEKLSCSDRSYYFDSELWVSRAIEHMLAAVRSAHGPLVNCSRPFPQMRFLHYQYEGGLLAPHVDLAKTGQIFFHMCVMIDDPCRY